MTDIVPTTQQESALTCCKEFCEIYRHELTNKGNGDIMLLQNMCKCYSIEDVLDKKTLPLVRIKKDNGDKFLRAMIKLEILKLNVRLSLKNKLSEYDVEYVANVIEREYIGLTIADIALFVDKVCNGEYGELYENINSSKVIQMFRKYFDQRCEVSEYRRMSASLDHREDLIKSTMVLRDDIPLKDAIHEWSEKMNQGYLEMDKIRRMTKGERRAKYWNEYYAEHGYAPNDGVCEDEARTAIDEAKTCLERDKDPCYHMLNARSHESQK